MPEQSDVLIFSPHQRFLAVTGAPERAEFRRMILTPHMQHAFPMAFAHMAACGASREELTGAQKFIELFQNFSEKNQIAPKPPEKALQSNLR